MENIKESILNYLKMKHTGALLISGDWGSGKTYFLKNKVLPHVKDRTDFLPVMVSLYGEKNRSGIAKKIIYGFLDSKVGFGKVSIQKLAGWISKAAPFLPKINDYVDLSKIIDGSEENILKFLPSKKVIIVLDDLERKSEKLKMEDLLGLVNDLVENSEIKVILVANKKQITPEELKFEEKTIERTLEFSPDLRDVFESLFGIYERTSVGNLLRNDKEFFIASLTSETGDDLIDLELREAFSNIRTLKFALEHFKSIFDVFFNDRKLSDVEIEQLKNVWIFVLSVSAEFKSNRLSLSNKNKIDVQVTTFADLDFSDISIGGVDTERENENYSKTFKEKYFSRLGERYIYYPEIYDFLLGGFPINQEGFSKTLQEKFFLKDGEVRESYNLLNQIMREWWTFSGEVFTKKLKALMDYIQKGEFEEALSYLNAGNFLFEYSEFIDLGSKDVFEKIKAGLKIGLSKCEFIFREKTTLEMVKDQFTRPELVELTMVAEDLLNERQVQLEEEEVLKVLNLFKSNFIEFVSQLIDRTNENSGKYSSRSYLDRLSEDDIKTWLENISLPEIGQLDHLIASRYLRRDNLYNYLQELEFLEKLEGLFGSIGAKKSSIEWHVLNRMVLPKVKNALAKVKDIKGSISRK